MDQNIAIEKATRWYGQVIGVNEISLEVKPGVTGLLGPNGAGKSTLMKMIMGQILPNQGLVRVTGKDPFYSHRLKGLVGYVPEVDALPERERGEAFLRKRAYLRGYPSKNVAAIAKHALARVGLEDAGSKKIGAYSRGMRQRLKLAQCVFHDPKILVLDEPLTGLDPVGRRQMIGLIRELGGQGKTVLVSSHVLHEVEQMTERVILIARGKVLATGTIEHIRSLIDAHPHTVDIETPAPVELSLSLLRRGCVVSVNLEEREGALRIKTRNPDLFYDTLGRLVTDEGIEVESLRSPDNNLQAVFEYLVK